MRTSDERVVLWLSASFVLLMLVAFTPSYFRPLATGTFQGSPIFHLHGALFFAWPALLLSQSYLAAKGRLELHRSLGLIGIALATSMFFTGIAAIASDLRLDQEGLALVAFGGLATFTLFFVMALAFRKRRDHHLRWMFLATLAIMQAVSARLVVRVFLQGPPGPPPAGVPQIALAQRAGMIHLLFDVLVLSVVAIVDWRKSGRVHPVYIVGGSILMAMHAFRHNALETNAWKLLSQGILSLTH